MTTEAHTEKHAALGALLIDIMNGAPSAPDGVIADAPHPPAARDRTNSYATESEAPEDILNDRLYQAHGLSVLLYGDGLDVFRSLADDIQDGVLWALSSLIHDAMIASKRLPDADATMVEKLGNALEKARGAA